MTPAVLVDTSVLSWYLHRDARSRYPDLVAWLDSVIVRDGLHISAVTLFEIRRGIGELRARGQGAKKAARVEMLLRQATILGLDGSDFQGWKTASDLWVQSRTRSPALVLSDGDLLIAATAIVHKRALVTVDEKLRARLKELGLQATLHEIKVG